MERGTFIVFEGLDGSGLSTQSRKLTEYLEKKNKETVLTKEQTSGPIGGLIKAALKGEWEMDQRTLQLLFAGDRSHHVKNKIKPALKEEKIVISDRYFLSSMAFGSTGDLSSQWIKVVNSKFPEPDIILLIDTPPEVCMERLDQARFKTEIFEEKEKLDEVRKNFRKLADEFDNVYTIEGDKDKEKVFGDILETLEEENIL